MSFPILIQLAELVTPYIPVALAEDDQFKGGIVVRVEGCQPGSIRSPAHYGEKADQVLAFSCICPHMGCRLETHTTVRYPRTGESVDQLVYGPCRCHGTSFDLGREGLVILGPSSQNLAQLKLELTNDGTGVAATGWRHDPEPNSHSWP